MSNHRRFSIAGALCLGMLTATATSGCGHASHAGSARAGAAQVAKVRQIVLEASDPADPETLYLAKQIEARSRGGLSVQIDSQYNSTEPANEVRLAKAVRAGTVSFAFVPSRAWESAGVPVFAALQAPFVLGSYPVVREALDGPAGRTLLGRLTAAGVHPLALVPLQLRRLLSVKPITSQGDLDGLRVRIVDNPTTKLALRSLGAVPVEGLSSREAETWLGEHKIDALETAGNAVAENAYEKYAKYLSGFALFSKVGTFVASQRAWSRLDAAQRAALQDAAADLQRFTVGTAARDQATLLTLCRSGVRVPPVTSDQLQTFSQAAQPTINKLSADPATAQVLLDLEETAGAGIVALGGPTGCKAAAVQAALPKSTVSTIPDGTYVTTTSVADLRAQGQYGDDWNKAIVWRFKIHDGQWIETQQPDYPDQGGCRGPFIVKADQVTFNFDPDPTTDPGCSESSPEVLKWSYYAGKLAFQIVDVQDTASRAIYVSHPWRKVG
jgi:TRAP-type C4-dicarboxylate transport system substrate-binding protein